ncbi:HhH-GPD family protein [Olsenella urininfantis]|uniref:adenine glycosylase n=1 Tax=Olsenella urininfantis TaxID=1871033 RepID=UPI000984248A|nr:adenine glycosylase [Olsenella urininfantis]
MASEEDLSDFRSRVLERGRELYRDLPWRRTRDPYQIWISEVMLQQTQVARVDGRWQRWCERFPSPDALAAASSADVLEEWQGMGYNRRALSLWKAAAMVSAAGGEMPCAYRDLLELPGIGPATAAGIRAFAFSLPGVYLETNVRSVFIHELFPGVDGVSDKDLVPLVERCCPPDDGNPEDDPRSWYYALLDYGAHLKRTIPNPSRRSSSHVRQSRFEGSHRQKRAALLRLLLAQDGQSEGGSLEALTTELSDAEVKSGRPPLSEGDVLALLEELEREGFCHCFGGIWHS